MSAAETEGAGVDSSLRESAPMKGYMAADVMVEAANEDIALEPLANPMSWSLLANLSSRADELCAEEALSEASDAFQQFSPLDRIAIYDAASKRSGPLSRLKRPIMLATIFVLTFFSQSICGRYLSSRRIGEKHPTAFAPWGPLCTAGGDHDDKTHHFLMPAYGTGS